MKNFTITIAAMLLTSVCVAQKWELGSDLVLSQPVGGMTRTMNNAFGMTLNFARKFKSPFAVGTELAFGSYGSQTTPQQYTFDNGEVTETNVVVNNNIYTVNLTGKYFLRNNRKVNPYLSGKLGITWFETNLTIEDPADQYSCHPLESDILQKDHTYLASGGAGVRIDFSSIFKKMDSEKFYFDASVHSTQGGIVRYMNAEISNGNQLPDKDVTAKFLNTTTQVIHEHHVGYVYTSLVNMVEYRIGVVCRPGWQ